MQRENSALVDFASEGTSERFFSRPPLVTSHRSSWNSLHLEHHLLPETDTGEHHLTQHCICLVLNSFVCDRWLDHRFYRDVCNKGTIAIIPADVMHRAASLNKQLNFITLSMSQNLFNQAAQDWASPDVFQPIPHTAHLEDPLIMGIGLALKAEMESGYIGGRLYEESLATAITVHLLRHYCNHKPKTKSYSNGLSSSKLRSALDYIQDNLDQSLSLDELARQVGISQYYFCSLFKQSVGVSPWQYVIERRIERAKELLRTSEMSLSEIALLCGFANQNHLNRHFRKLVGVTPKAYRNQ
jgi:AraC family transcriptional regulator